MTIIAKGHVLSINIGAARAVRVTVQLEMSRGGGQVVLDAERTEVTAYYPGMGVELRLMPSAPAEGRSEPGR